MEAKEETHTRNNAPSPEEAKAMAKAVEAAKAANAVEAAKAKEELSKLIKELDVKVNEVKAMAEAARVKAAKAHQQKKT